MRFNIRAFSIKKSFSARLSLYTSLCVLILYLLTAFVVLYYSRKIITEESFANANSELLYTTYRIESELNIVETAIENVLKDVKVNRNDPEKMLKLTEDVLEYNPMIYTCIIAFAPNFYEHSELFAAFAYYPEGGTECEVKQMGADYNYTYMEWYLIPKLMGIKYWTDPYFDSGGSNDIVYTYSVPLYDENEEFYGVITANISINWLKDLVGGVRAYDNSSNLLISKSATYLFHKENSRIYNETIFTANEDQKDKDKIYSLAKSMIRGETGMACLKLDGIKNYVFYAPVPSSGWSLGITVPHYDIFKGVHSMTSFIIIMCILGMLIIFYFSNKIIKDQTASLSVFSDSARRIAEGDFEAELPKIESEDEMKELYNSFKYMQHSIKQYIKELKDSSSERERIAGELNVAKQIQLDMVPKVFPPYPERGDIDVYAMLQPAKEVGGDLYDYFIEKDIFYFIIGDVSGKGVPASLFMAVTRGIFRSVAANYDDPNQTVSFLNASVAETNESEMFVTLFVGQLNLKTGWLKFCNAGHNPPVILTADGSAEFMKVNSNIPVGLFDEFTYESESIQLPRECNLVFYTDGLTEAENINSELYSERRLMDSLTGVKGMNVRQITEHIVSSVEAHVNGSEQSDDITILTINWK